MLSNKEIICPNNLLNVAHRKKGVKIRFMFLQRILLLRYPPDYMKIQKEKNWFFMSLAKG